MWKMPLQIPIFSLLASVVDDLRTCSLLRLVNIFHCSDFQGANLLKWSLSGVPFTEQYHASNNSIFAVNKTQHLSFVSLSSSPTRSTIFKVWFLFPCFACGFPLNCGCSPSSSVSTHGLGIFQSFAHLRQLLCN